MIETAQVFGPDANLVGLLTQPSDPPPGPPGRVVMLFNAGIISRIGPHRLNVKLARALAAAGEWVLRFDLSGHGDSGAAQAPALGSDQELLDLRAAMDHLQRTLGVARFVVVGVCSGAVSAYWLARQDERVCAVLMFDGYWFRSRWTTPARHWRYVRSASMSQLWAALMRRLRRGSAAGRLPSAVPSMYSGPSHPSRAEFAAAMQQFVAAGREVLMVFSGSAIDFYSYSLQFRHVFAGEPWLDKVECELMADVDHSFLALHAQEVFVRRVVRWLRGFPRATAAEPRRG